MNVYEFICGIFALSLGGAGLAFLIWLVVHEQVSTKKCPVCNGTGRLPKVDEDE